MGEQRRPVRRAAGWGVEVTLAGGDAVRVPLVLGVGRNYKAHADEQAADLPDRPMIFTKHPTSCVSAGDAIVLPRIAADEQQVDYEGELAVVLGRDARDVARDEAADPDSGVILGYACANDVSARWWQKKGSGGQFVRGKSFATFCPIGPEVVPAAEVGSWGGPTALTLRTTVSGEVLQEGRAADMIFTVDELVSELSRDTILPAGTVILTGTPSGVGMARTPPRWLEPGDEVVVEIGVAGEPAKLGRLASPVRGPA